MHKRKIFLTVIIVLAAAAGLSFYYFKKDRILPAEPLPPERTYERTYGRTYDEAAPAVPEDKPAAEAPGQEPVAEKQAALPAEVNLKIPFTSQAPHKNWDLPYQHFCEEASALMAASYIQNQTIAGPDDADAKLLAVKKFEDKKFGFYKDTTAEETAVILREYFGLEKVEIAADPTIADIKSALALGRAVIVPLAGRQIGNPNYKQPGPLYHMLVIKGYKKNSDFITNDPGTRKGADYTYRPDVIMDAIHDWNGGDVDTGKKVMLIVG